MNGVERVKDATRDFTRLLALIETSAILHQAQRQIRELEGEPTVTAGLEDYYVARVLVGEDFGATTQGWDKKVAEVVDGVWRLYDQKLAGSAANAALTVGERTRSLCDLRCR